MTPEDHRKTSSWGNNVEHDAVTGDSGPATPTTVNSNVYRAQQRALIEKGLYKQAFQMDVDNLIALFGNKYAKGIQQALQALTDGTWDNCNWWNPPGGSDSPTISGNGDSVAFASTATNLVPAAVNGAAAIYVRRRSTGLTELVSVSSSGSQANDGSWMPSISSDGRYVAFESYATNLTAGGTGGFVNIYVRDTAAGTTTKVSVDPYGLPSNGNSYQAAISGDGRYIAFESWASNLVSFGTSGRYDVFVRDLSAGTTRLASVTPSGVEANGDSYAASISNDGRYIAFQSFASDLLSQPTTTPGSLDVYRRDISLGTTTRVSVDSGGQQANGQSFEAAISGNGRYVGFRSQATNLTASSNGSRQIYLHDSGTGATIVVSVSSGGDLGNNESSGPPSISGDGNYTTYGSGASNLVPSDTNGAWDVFEFDKAYLATSLLSYDSQFGQGNGYSAYYVAPAISADGVTTAFSSDSTNFPARTPNGTAADGSSDVYVHVWNTARTVCTISLISVPDASGYFE